MKPEKTRKMMEEGVKRKIIVRERDKRKREIDKINEIIC